MTVSEGQSDESPQRLVRSFIIYGVSNNDARLLPDLPHVGSTHKTQCKLYKARSRHFAPGTFGTVDVTVEYEPVNK